MLIHDFGEDDPELIYGAGAIAIVKRMIIPVGKKERR